MVGVGVEQSSKVWTRRALLKSKQINISTFWLSSVPGSHPRVVDSNFAEINHTSLLPLTINPQWVGFPLLLPRPPSPEGVTRIWVPVFFTLLLTAIHFRLSLLLIDTKLLQRRSKSPELPQLKLTRHSQPIRLLSQLQPGR